MKKLFLFAALFCSTLLSAQSKVKKDTVSVKKIEETKYVLFVDNKGSMYVKDSISIQLINYIKELQSKVEEQTVLTNYYKNRK